MEPLRVFLQLLATKHWVQVLSGKSKSSAALTGQAEECLMDVVRENGLCVSYG
jgi:hypothetical protein